MNQVFASIKMELTTNDELQQLLELLLVFQHAAAGKDISSIASAAYDKVIASPPSTVCKKLVFNLNWCMHLTSKQWEVMCWGIWNDFDFPDSNVMAATIPSWHLGKFITDCNKEILNCIIHRNPNLCYAIVETLGLAHNNIVNLCVMNATLLDKVATWWW